MLTTGPRRSVCISYREINTKQAVVLKVGCCPEQDHLLRFEVHTAVKVTMLFFRIVAPFNLVGGSIFNPEGHKVAVGIGVICYSYSSNILEFYMTLESRVCDYKNLNVTFEVLTRRVYG
jgi:hypothetical protein